MKYEIAHELPGRMRLRCGRAAFSDAEAVVVEYLLGVQEGVRSVVACSRTGSILVLFEPEGREAILSAVGLLDRSYLEGESLPASQGGSESIGAITVKFFGTVFLRRLLPFVVRVVASVLRYIPFFLRGLRSLILSRKLDVSVLDAAAIGVSILYGDFGAAALIMSLLVFGELLEEWTKERSRKGLAAGLAMNVDHFWIEKDGAEIRIPAKELQLSDRLVLRAGTSIPVDGTIVRGEAMVNQSVMTGEPLAVHRFVGTTVYAGTVIEEGEIVVSVTAYDKDTRINRIVRMIDESESMKAEVQGKAERLADSIVPYSFLLAGLVYLFTRSVRKATSILLVDYSCAIKLSTPLAILSAMKEGAKRGIVIKGGRALEKISEADTVVFDKTGTLSVASPKVAEILPLGGYSREQVLRTAACIEEHFPHPIARAVVRRAEEEKLSHREEHSKVEYIVAHGIVSRIGDKRVIIGSSHFVLEDEAIPLREGEAEVINKLAQHYSLLYLAIGGGLAGIICIEDPLRPEAAAVIAGLRKAGIKNIVMLTGDAPKTAEHVAGMLGIEMFGARLLPEDKTEYVKKMRESGARVLMVGDGINDSPALSTADVGIAMKDGADIAREVSDVVLARGSLNGVLEARELSAKLMGRIYSNYCFIVAINSLLLGLGLTGFISPALSAVLHNASTIGASMRSMTPLSDERSEER